MTPRVERASESDRDAIVRLLSDHQLTIEGLHRSTVLVVREGKEIIGTAALEVYREGALLRSVAIARGQQGRGLGHKLTTAAIRLAQDLNVPSIFLMTMTAEGFFTRFGFEQVVRADVPESVLASIQFSSACPASATVMRKRLPEAT
jgi:amino-acid N-acetyltransferase